MRIRALGAKNVREHYNIRYTSVLRRRRKRLRTTRITKTDACLILSVQDKLGRKGKKPPKMLWFCAQKLAAQYCTVHSSSGFLRNFILSFS